MMTTMTTMTTQQRSWADIVKGNDSSANAPQPLQPAKKGERRCFCQGEILVMLGHYGWILSFNDIDHPDVGKTGGRIYVHKKDVIDAKQPVAGDVVSFYLYADEQGLGAECCELEQSALPTMNADAPEFQPACQLQDASCAKPSWNVNAYEFVPSVEKSIAREFMPAFPCDQKANQATAVAINLAFFSDDDSDDDESDTDDEVAPVSPKTKGPPSIDGSTSAGESSDSDTEDVAAVYQKAFGRKMPPWFRQPPGLTLPA